jgi:hypothetical protein
MPARPTSGRRSSDDRQIKRAAAESGYSASGGRVRHAEMYRAFRKRAGRPARTSPDPLPAECCGERNPKWSRCTITSVPSGATLTRRSGTATRISSGATAELCIQGSHVHTRQPTERQTPGVGTQRRSTACCKRWRNPRPHCCQQLSKCYKNWRNRPGPTGKREQFTMPRKSPTWRARHSRP